MNYDAVVVGAGFTGAALAYQFAKDGKKVLVLEKRADIAGNMYDYKDDKTGILIQKYGVHSFHTNHKKVFDFITAVDSRWAPFVLRAYVSIKGQLTPSPFNFDTVEQYFTREDALEIKKALAETFDYEAAATILQMLNSENEYVRKYAEFLYEEDYKPYTSKQWGIEPDELDPFILRRVPVRLSYINQYFDDKYQVQPVNGYTSFFETMLSDKNIKIELNQDALKRLHIADHKVYLDSEPCMVPVIYTGPVDELFHYQYGRLPYRSLEFKYQTVDVNSYQPSPGVAYPKETGYTRITEFSKLMLIPPKTGRSVIAYEYPSDYVQGVNEAFYPVLTKQSQEMADKYKKEAGMVSGLFVCGRLGDFQYYNMDQALQRALELYKLL